MTQCGSTRLRPPRRHPSRTRPLACLTLTALALWLAPGLVAQGPSSAIEYQVKAAFLYNFAKFVDWPPETFTRQDALFVVGVLGNDSFGDVLEQVIHGKTINGRAFDVRRLKGPEEAAGCQMVFVGVQET